MAKIFPNRLPQSVIDDPKRGAERKVYQALRELPDRYRIFYSMHWQKQNAYNGISEGEADFVIAHPDKGVLVREVKGGAISYNGQAEKWYSQNLAGDTFEIRDPVEQGRRSHYRIKEDLEHLQGWPNRPLNIWHAVCFPDIHLKPGMFLRPDLDRRQVIDAEDLETILPTIERLYDFCFGKNISNGAPGSDRIQMIEGLLANSFEIQSPLGVELGYEDEKLIELTDQQFHAMALLGDRKRAAIAGCAGSGKTMLAVHKALQFRDLGMSVLLVCFNVALSEDLRKRLPDIDVYNFHDLCKQAANQAGYQVRQVKDDNEYYDELLPEALLEAAEKIGRVYDAVIVDEAQDFKDNYWIALESLLKEDGHLYIFFDNNQNLFGGMTDFGGLITEQPFALYQNCRNTKEIHKVVAAYHNNPAGILCLGPEGRKPEVIEFTDDEDMLRQLQKLVHHLVVEEQVDNDDIVILTPHGEARTALKPGLKLGIFSLTSQVPGHQSQIQATSIQKFKGLERRVVIIAELDQKYTYNRDMVMYVGCSRARTHLILLQQKNLPQQVRDSSHSET